MDTCDWVRTHFPDVIAADPAMTSVLRKVIEVAKSNLDVVLIGESGVGKELLAQSIHRLSERSKGPLVAISMAALPEAMIEAELFGHHRGAFTGALETRSGRFEQANTGTLFLDEIGSLPLGLQSKLLRALQERAYYPIGGTQLVQSNVRVIAAADQNLIDLVKGAKFEAALYFRFQVSIRIPPLRDRPGDVGAIANAHIESCNRKYGKQFSPLTRSTIQFLGRQPWPGNVRQLLSVVEWAVVQSEDGERILSIAEFEPLLTEWTTDGESNAGLPQDKMTLHQILGELTRRRLLLFAGNRSEAAKSLGVTRGTFRNWCYRYNVSGFDREAKASVSEPLSQQTGESARLGQLN